MHSCHPTLATYLHDLETRHALPIRYQRWSARYSDPAPFRREIELLGPIAGTATECRFPYRDGVAVVDLVNGRPHTGEPVEITAGDETFVVASVEGRRIRLAFDLERLFEQPEDIQPGRVLETVLGAAVPLAAQYVQDYDWQRERTEFSTWMVSSVDGMVRNWKNAIRDNEYEASRITSQLSGLVRKNGELREQIVALEATTRPAQELRATEEFAALVKMMPSPVVSVEVDYGKLSIVLEPLTLEHDSTDYHMGSYTLTVTADKVHIWSDGGFSYPHPHVSSDGVPCWGNLGPGIGKLLGEGQYAALVAVIWEFLHSYNERDAYRHIETWDPDYNSDDE